MADDQTTAWRWPWRRDQPTPGGETAQPGAQAQDDYPRLVLDVLARCDDLHQQWLEAMEEQRRHERLANAVAVYHWYLSGLRERLLAAEVPAAFRTWHEVLVTAVDSAVQATRAMSHGYRFHNVRRICEGGLLLEEARAQALAVREGLVKLTGAAGPSPQQPTAA